MKKWKYCMATCLDAKEFEERLDELGSGGWELVSANYASGPLKRLQVVAGASIVQPGEPVWIGVLKRCQTDQIAGKADAIRQVT